jgi:3-isopropylmalate/(R)-2-methylmalate dehydratase small subunit
VRDMPAGPVTRVEGTALALSGADIDTDRIMPARFLRVLTFDGLGRHVFEDDRFQSAAHGAVHPFDDPRRAGASILIVNRNFGCGSSREHAPQGLLRWGIRALVGESFSEIFFGNATALGMPCVTAERDAVAELMEEVEREPALQVCLDLETLSVEAGRVRAQVRMPAAVRDALVSGTWDGTGLLVERLDEVEACARRLGYVR